MNESLLRDLHETEMEGLTELKSAIKELAETPTASPTDVAKVQMMLANIKLPAQDYTELKQYIYNTIMSTASNTNTQIAGVDKLVRSYNSDLVGIYNSIDKRLAELAEQQQQDKKPQVHIHRLDFTSWKVFVAVISLGVIAFGATCYTLKQQIEIDELRANDLKYRYIKMVGDIDDRLVYDLEELIYKDKDGKVLKEMKKQIEDYERAIELKIRAEEQARLNQAESAKLDKQIKELQKK
ncbi:MAG: hypothetical protein SNG47_03335 [Rikenellaceae bacterium]